MYRFFALLGLFMMVGSAAGFADGNNPDHYNSMLVFGSLLAGIGGFVVLLVSALAASHDELLSKIRSSQTTPLQEVKK